ncbi:DUF4956 domain-containing protein [Carboxylicivirga sp. N1Y90]|uniref:DUF4956 domain-containing protein n=1 Tax=Carboxylicivirga fragile TaxID=3417571 RepID=UPI003D32AD76|nr:DUF4956 domain-containing protein [Marinilabiliaceae bacterium N1Y90]
MFEISEGSVLLSLFVRFVSNFLVLAIIVWGIYFPSARRKEYVFTYALISKTVFFMTFFLASVELELGFALGLFAIFGIIRYRTSTIPIREMTYLFLLIAVAVINAVSLEEYLFPEVFIANVVFVLLAFLMEKLWMNKGEQRKTIVYEKIELLRPEKREALHDDLHRRTGLDIHKVEIGHIDFLKDTAVLTVYFSSIKSDTILSDFEVINGSNVEEVD